MKTHWLGLLIFVALALVASGCPPAEEAAKPEAAKPEAPAAVGIDSSKLPPPRTPLADTPDLQNARFRITDQSLERMKEDGVPDNVVSGLNSLKGTEYTNASEFFDAVRGAVGAQGLEDNQPSIVRNSLVVTLAVEAAFPGAELKLTALQPMGSPGFGAVFFDFDKSNIKPEFRSVIQANAEKLMGDTSLRVTIEGHCDERGTTEYNLALGERRANAMKEAMIAAGVNADQLDTVSFGEERPADEGHNEEAWAKNRRSILVIN